MKKRQRERAKRIVTPEEVKKKVLRFRVTEKDYKAIHQTAEKNGTTVSLFIIECLRSKVHGIS